MNSKIHPLDVVALVEDLPEQNLCRGQVGTVVEELTDPKGTLAFLVEFSEVVIAFLLDELSTPERIT